jgi:ATP-dependent Clp protease ATP-binding subunit ClpC
MYSAFTDLARSVMETAERRAQALRHETVQTEHVLLALLVERIGVASSVLRNLGVDRRKLRTAVEEALPQGVAKPTRAKLPHDPLTLQVVEFATKEAELLHHPYVGTEHLLLSLLAVEQGAAAKILSTFNLNLADLRLETVRVLEKRAE